MEPLRVLGIETSCDETAMAVLEGEGEQITIRANVISSQVKLHAQYGGVYPAMAAREHTRNIRQVFQETLQQAGIKDFKKEIDLIAVTYGPGLGPSLMSGITFARALAWHYDIPIIGVNHMDGHIHSNWLTPIGEISNFQFLISKDTPALNLIVSGGHTELVLMKDHGTYEIIGETLDDAVGEAFDKVARLLGLEYPGGPAISKLAEEGDPQKYPLPKPMAHSKDYNFSYSGLKTAVLYLLRDLGEITTDTKKDIAASFQHAAIEVLVEKTLRAAQEYKAHAVLLSGGVSANKLLRTRLEEKCAQRSIRYFKPKMIYTTDNAAMIATAGYFAHKKQKNTDWKSVTMDANLTL